MKQMKRISALLLVLVLALSMTACGEKKVRGLEGTWHTELPMTDTVNEAIAGMGVDTSELRGFDRLELNFCIDLELRDGRYTLSMNKRDTQKSFDEYFSGIKEIMTDYAYDMGKSQGLSREETDDLFLEAYGMDVEGFVGSAFDEAAESMENSTAVEDENGVYAATKDKIYFGRSEKDLKKKDACVEYTLKGHELSLNSVEGNALDLESLLDLGFEFPMVFTK